MNGATGAVRDRCGTGHARSQSCSRLAPAYAQFRLKRDGFSSNRHPALGYCWSMMFSDLASPAEAPSHTINCTKGFAQAGNRYPLFGIMV
jgi:hypothetical protein